MKMFLTAVMKDEHTTNDSLQSDSSFLLRNSMMTNTTRSYIIEIPLFACSLHRKFALFFSLIIYDRVLKFSAIMYYYLTTRRHFSSLKFEKIMQR